MSDEDTVVLLKTEKIAVTSNPKEETYQNVILKRYQSIFSSIATLISGLIFGYDLGLSTNIIKPFSSILNLNCSQHFCIISAWLTGVFLAAVFGGYIIDTIGRQKSITISMLLLLISSLLISIPELSNLSQFYSISRLISGFAGPLSAIAQFIYISELSEPENRGFRITIHQLGMASGSIISYASILYFDLYSKCSRLVTQIVGMQTILVIYITLCLLPPSPHSMIKKENKDKKNKRSFRIEILIENIGLALFLVEVQQLCGRYTVLYYSPRLFSLVGICATEATKFSICFYSVIKFLATGLCLLIVDKLGRRMSLIMSSTIMMICLSFLALLASIDDPEPSSFFSPDNCGHLSISHPNPDSWRLESVALPKSPPPYPMLPTPLSFVSSQSESCSEEAHSSLNSSLRIAGIVSVIFYQVADVLGYGTITWIILSEIFPISIKGKCICAITMIYWMDIGAPSMFTQLGSSTIGSTFLIYSFICMGSILVTYNLIPETRNKSLFQISEELRNISLIPRFYENLSSLPFIGNSEWLKKRIQNLPQNESSII